MHCSKCEPNEEGELYGRLLMRFKMSEPCLAQIIVSREERRQFICHPGAGVLGRTRQSMPGRNWGDEGEVSYGPPLNVSGVNSKKLGTAITSP
jgi:hypothetical protein